MQHLCLRADLGTGAWHKFPQRDRIPSWCPSLRRTKVCLATWSADAWWGSEGKTTRPLNPHLPQSPRLSSLSSSFLSSACDAQHTRASLVVAALPQGACLPGGHAIVGRPTISHANMTHHATARRIKVRASNISKSMSSSSTISAQGLEASTDCFVRFLRRNEGCKRKTGGEEKEGSPGI